MIFTIVYSISNLIIETYEAYKQITFFIIFFNFQFFFAIKTWRVRKLPNI